MRGRGGLRGCFAVGAAAALLAACAGSPGGGPDQVNRLAGRSPTVSGGAEHAERIVDGTLAPAGDFWNTPLTAILPTADSYIAIDLGEVVPIAAAFLQGDNNDRYLLSGSIDGTTFTPLWEAPPMRGAGLRVRKSDSINGRARYLRLSAAGGDGAYSVSELQVFSVAPGAWPSRRAAAAATRSRPTPSGSSCSGWRAAPS